MKTAKGAAQRKGEQRSREAALGIKRVEVKLSAREREQLETLCHARAGSGEPYSADEYISTLLRRDWEHWMSQEDNLKMQVCKHCNCQLPAGCHGAFKGVSACWHTEGDKTLAL